MNKDDRKSVAALVSRLEALKGEVESVGEELRTLADAEQEKFDNMAEGLQAGEQGQAIETAAGVLTEAADAAEGGSIGEALESLGQLEL